MLRQYPPPGEQLLRYQGDCLEIALYHTPRTPGQAFLRTTLGHGATRLQEIVDAIEQRRTRLSHAWHDIPMERQSSDEFRLVYPLLEVGFFEAKAYFLPDGSDEPIWANGDNIKIKVDPADICCAGIIYNAYVRQFAPGKSHAPQLPSRLQKRADTLNRHGFTVIPPSGTFRDFAQELDFVIGELGCTIIQLLPIHPTPTVYGRMGRFGSAFASLDVFDVDPALAQFDRKKSPFEQFQELIDAIHARAAKVIIDIAINHTGWGSKLHETHPEWFMREADGAYYSPRAWGVIWEDLIELDYQHHDLWLYMADVFLHWCRRGIDGFRCDAAYKVPVAAWEYIVAKVRLQFPHTIFLLEGLGGPMATTVDLLTTANMNWAYSELFQNYDRAQIEHYLPIAIRCSQANGLMVHFAETHDNNRLAAVSQRYAHLRMALSALTSANGCYAFANGVEWYATEKISVHDAASLNWDSEENQVSYIRRINRIVNAHPAFHPGSEISMIQRGAGNSIAVRRQSHLPETELLVLVNLDHHRRNAVQWRLEDVGIGATGLDLLSGKTVAFRHDNGLVQMELAPGEVLCLGTEKDSYTTDPSPIGGTVDRNTLQRLRAKALAIRRCYHPETAVGAIDVDSLQRELHADPLRFYAQIRSETTEPRVVFVQWPQDQRRQIPVLPGFLIYFQMPCRFRVEVSAGKSVARREESLPRADGAHFVLLTPFPAPSRHQAVTCTLELYEHGQCQRGQCRLLLLSSIATAMVRYRYTAADIAAAAPFALAANVRGAMSVAHAAWGELTSRYDVLLAGNLNPRLPEDRQAMLRRYRIWIRYRGYSQELTRNCLEAWVKESNDSSCWEFVVPVGNHTVVGLHLRLTLAEDDNAITLSLKRLANLPRRQLDVDPKSPCGAEKMWEGHSCAATESGSEERPRVAAPKCASHLSCAPKIPYSIDVESLALDIPIVLIIRPDIEDRNFHEVVKAYTGPQDRWPSAIRVESNGFEFTPHPHRRLIIRSADGEFHGEAEWSYMVEHARDRERGQDFCSDLFSPGYFRLPLRGDSQAQVVARIVTKVESDNAQCRRLHPQPIRRGAGDREQVLAPTFSPKPPNDRSLLLDALAESMSQFIVRRDDNKTVLAGFPWFLDWGRDTLICARGMTAAGMLTDVRAILREFAAFEEEGTLPNIIHGQTIGNRDTSDAPLWLLVACNDLVRQEGDLSVLAARAGARAIGEVVESIVRAYIRGAANGVRMDPKTGLIFSPSHFSWMDTNYPAGTPRQGYPIEIQALWYAGLEFASRAVGAAEFATVKDTVGESIRSLYFDRERGYLADCIHCAPGVSALDGIRDDALRPNQLLAITLGAIRDGATMENVLRACQQLLVPGAIRSLADREVRVTLPIYRDGRLINDPQRPYWGRYEGPEDERRKPAYHNGTAWTWLFPAYSEAWFLAYGEDGRATAQALLGSSTVVIDNGCVAQVPELVDGDYPHMQRGCFAQAWGVTELYRVLKLLSPA